MKNKKILLTRFGGIGDVFPVLVAAEQLHKRGWEVDVALRYDGGIVRQTDICQGLSFINKAMDYEQIGPWGTRTVLDNGVKKSIECIYDRYDDVVDFMFIVEGNSTCKSDFLLKPNDHWKKSRNSNWTNWYDLHLSWVNINPTSVPDSEKRPKLVLNKTEKTHAKWLKKTLGKAILFNCVASSRARTWYQYPALAKKIMEEMPDTTIGIWDVNKNQWEFIKEGKKLDIKNPGFSPMRYTMVLIEACGLFISADTGTSHISEGLNKKNITLYSTVPAWTRSKYYKHQISMDSGVGHDEYYTFSLTSGDPLRIEEEINKLSDREKLLQKLYTNQTPAPEAAIQLNTDIHGLEMEARALNEKIKSWEHLQSKSLTKISVDEVFNKIKEVL